jgi:hypothetical protein
MISMQVILSIKNILEKGVVSFAIFSSKQCGTQGHHTLNFLSGL